MERRLDTWLETGRQLVDGVSGRRPGQRRTSLDLDSMGRWVGEKVEWLLDDDDDWREPWQEQAPLEESGEAASVRCRPCPVAGHLLQMTAGLKMTVFVCSAGRETELDGRQLDEPVQQPMRSPRRPLPRLKSAPRLTSTGSVDRLKSVFCPVDE